jgi:fructokinase
MEERPLMVGLGEVLWDLLPSGKMLGGAPTNFAYMASIFGNRGIVASRVGNDELGYEACAVMSRYGLSTSFVQKDDHYETGTAGIFLGPDGQPKFTIRQPVAWDFLEWTADWDELSSKADVVCFGSLAQRSPGSSATIERFLQNTRDRTLKICDANLREPFYTTDVLRRSFSYADVLKLNKQELFHVASLLQVEGDDTKTLARGLFREFDLQLICITKGAQGSLLMSKEEVVEHSGMFVQVADTIGAGDAFTACVAHCYMQGRSLAATSESANRLAAWVASQVGATPHVPGTKLVEIMACDFQAEENAGN